MIIKNKYGYCEYTFEKDYVHIYNFYVLPEHRKQGKAKEILRIVIDAIRKTGYEDLIQIVADPVDKNIDVGKLKKFYISMGLDVYDYYGGE